MKKNKHFITAILLGTMTTFTSCKQNQNKESEENEEPITENVTDNTVQEITIEKLQNSPAYSDAALILENPTDGKLTSGGEIDFTFKVDNYELGAQTQSGNTELLANSGKGQHIHFILNNQPYSAHYEPVFKKEIPDGVHHLVAFLSRSYHESVKNENTVVVQKLEVGQNPKDSIGLDMDSPTLIYSRPKGEYVGKDTENLLLDFFVLNTILSDNGNKVRATINDKEFLITEWAPYIIKGLPMGEVTIKLILIDAQGNPIPGPFNQVTRTVTLKQ